jgi:hypothetical protein
MSTMLILHRACAIDVQHSSSKKTFRRIAGNFRFHALLVSGNDRGSLTERNTNMYLLNRICKDHPECKYEAKEGEAGVEWGHG